MDDVQAVLDVLGEGRQRGHRRVDRRYASLMQDDVPVPREVEELVLPPVGEDAVGVELRRAKKVRMGLVVARAYISRRTLVCD